MFIKNNKILVSLIEKKINFWGEIIRGVLIYGGYCMSPLWISFRVCIFNDSNERMNQYQERLLTINFN